MNLRIGGSPWSWFVPSSPSMPSSLVTRLASRSAPVVHAAGSSLGSTAALLLILACEAGVPVPVPVDLAMIALGAAVGRGSISIWVAVVALEVVAGLGTACLLLVARGPLAGVLTRLGPRVGLTAPRLDGVRARVHRRGRPVLVLGRATPGLRTLTVGAAATTGLPVRRVLPPLVLGSSLFLQVHLLIGLSLAAPLVAVLGSPAGRITTAILVCLLIGVAVVMRRRRRAAPAAWREGVCPACLALSALGSQAAGADRRE